MIPCGPGITIEERGRLVELLRDSEGEFLALTRGLTDFEWTYKAAPERWSVQETAEHLILGEKVMLARVREALAGPPHPEWEEEDARKTRFLDRVLPDRGRKATAPAFLEPHHNWTCHEALARYQEGRATTLKFIEEVDGPMKNQLARHSFPVFGMLNAYQWLLYIPLHNIRHNQQIAEAIGEIVR